MRAFFLLLTLGIMFFFKNVEASQQISSENRVMFFGGEKEMKELINVLCAKEPLITTKKDSLAKHNHLIKDLKQGTLTTEALNLFTLCVQNKGDEDCEMESIVAEDLKYQGKPIFPGHTCMTFKGNFSKEMSQKLKTRQITHLLGDRKGNGVHFHHQSSVFVTCEGDKLMQKKCASSLPEEKETDLDGEWLLLKIELLEGCKACQASTQEKEEEL